MLGKMNMDNKPFYERDKNLIAHVNSDSLSAEEVSQLLFEKTLKYKQDMEEDFDEHIVLPKADYDRVSQAQKYHAARRRCPDEHRELLLRLTCMLDPKITYYQTVWIQELAKMKPAEYNAAIDDVERYLEILTPSQLSSEHQSSFYRDLIGKKDINKRISDIQQTKLISINFQDNKQGIEKATEIHKFLDQTMKSKEDFNTMFDKSEHRRRGEKQKTELDKDQIMPAIEKATAYAKVALLTDNVSTFTTAVNISKTLDSSEEQKRFTEVVKNLKELADVRNPGRFFNHARQYIQKTQHNG